MPSNKRVKPECRVQSKFYDSSVLGSDSEVSRRGSSPNGERTTVETVNIYIPTKAAVQKLLLGFERAELLNIQRTPGEKRDKKLVSRTESGSLDVVPVHLAWIEYPEDRLKEIQEEIGDEEFARVFEGKTEGFVLLDGASRLRAMLEVLASVVQKMQIILLTKTMSFDGAKKWASEFDNNVSARRLMDVIKFFLAFLEATLVGIFKGDGYKNLHGPLRYLHFGIRREDAKKGPMDKVANSRPKFSQCDSSDNDSVGDNINKYWAIIEGLYDIFRFTRKAAVVDEKNPKSVIANMRENCSKGNGFMKSVGLMTVVIQTFARHGSKAKDLWQKFFKEESLSSFTALTKAYFYCKFPEAKGEDMGKAYDITNGEVRVKFAGNAGQRFYYALFAWAYLVETGELDKDSPFIPELYYHPLDGILGMARKSSMGGTLRGATRSVLLWARCNKKPLTRREVHEMLPEYGYDPQLRARTPEKSIESTGSQIREFVASGAVEMIDGTKRYQWIIKGEVGE